MNQHEELYWRTIGVAQKKVTLEEPLQRTDLIEASAPIDFPSRTHRKFINRMRDTEEWVPLPGPLPSGSSLCPDDAALAERVVQARELTALIEARANDSLGEWELSDARKLTLQRGHMPNWDVPAKPMINTRPCRIEPELRLLVQTAAARITADHAHPTRRHTSHGGFDMSTSDMSALLHGMVASYAIANGPSAYLDVYAAVADVFGAPPMPHVCMFQRSGPIRKAQPYHVMRSGVMTRLGEVIGWAPRTRHVFGPPLASNLRLRPGYAFMTGLIHALGLWPSHDVLAERAARLRLPGGSLHGLIQTISGRAGHLLYRDDISSFDTNVSREDQLALHRVLMEVRPDLSDTWAAWLELETLPVLAGPLKSGELARLYTMLGMTTSGGLYTTGAGTLISAARALSCMAHVLKRSAADVLSDALDQRLVFQIWGDDTLVSLPPIDTEAWDDHSAALGFPCEIAPGAAFLKRWHGMGTRDFGSAVRVFQQTVWNESGGTSPAIELLGLSARTEGIEFNPYWKIVEPYVFSRLPGSSLERYGVTNLMHLRTTVASPRFKADLLTDIKASPWVLEDAASVQRFSPTSLLLLNAAGELLGRPYKFGYDVSPEQALSRVPTIAEIISFAKAQVDGTEVPKEWAATYNRMNGVTT